MDWEDARHFWALAECGGFSGAARRLGVDHSTVARRVAALEAALGLRLIDRAPRSVTLTADGARIAALAGRMAAEAFALTRAADATGDAVRGVVRVSAPPALASALLAPRFAPLRRRHPELTVDLIGDVQAAKLDRHEADLALRLSPPQDDALIARKIGTMAFALYAAQDYPAAARPAAWAFVLHDDRPIAWPQHRWLESLRADRPIAFLANDLISLAAATAAGLGVALLPCFLGAATPGLIPLPFPVGSPEPPPSRALWLTSHDDLRRAPRVRAVMDFLIETIPPAL